MRSLEEIVYSLNTEDIQAVAEEDLSRQLTDEELDLVIDNLPRYIDWQGAITLSIDDALSTVEARGSS